MKWSDAAQDERKLSMARNITARFDEDLVDQIEAMADILGISVSQFLREAARHELDAVRSRSDFRQLVAEEKDRQARKFELIGVSSGGTSS